MIRIYTLRELVEYSPRQMILFGLLDNLDGITIEPHQKNYQGESRYKDVIPTCKSLFEYVEDIQSCDIAVLPYKYKTIRDPVFRELLSSCTQHNKILCIFFNDDYDQCILPYNKHIRLYRTSFYGSTRLANEFSLPAFSPDYFEGDFLITPEMSIGYCGHEDNNRGMYLQQLEKSYLNTDFILRSGFWAPAIDRLTARREYTENIRRNLFTFCYRGAGNFSSRFYEVLMMGRIPVLINTDCVFPFADQYNLRDLGVVINESDIEVVDLVECIGSYYHKHIDDLLTIQKNNRHIWEQYFSPIGFLYELSKSLTSICHHANEEIEH